MKRMVLILFPKGFIIAKLVDWLATLAFVKYA